MAVSIADEYSLLIRFAEENSRIGPFEIDNF